MNRKQRRTIKKKNTKKYTLEQIQRALGTGANIKKASKGHLYQKVLNKDKKTYKLSCIFCESSGVPKKECDYGNLTFIDRFQYALVNGIKDDTSIFIAQEDYIKIPYEKN